MASEHNPIAELIQQVQAKWTNEVSPFPELKLVRWIIKPEEARLFEGFLKLESTEHGAIPEILVTMLTPFKSEATHCADIMSDWVQAFDEDLKTKDKLRTKGMPVTWDSPRHLHDASDEPFSAFFNFLSSFHKRMIDKNFRLVVALFPHSIYDMEGYRRWLASMLKLPMPESISFMIFDHDKEFYFDGLFRKFPGKTKSLHINLDMDGAISKIAKMGDPASPEVKLRECILEMGKCVQNKDLQGVIKWGEKALQVTQKSGSKSMYATAFIISAGMLFNFKEYEKIDRLLEQGLTITKQGLKLEDAACKPLLVQYYGYLAASRQLQKKIKDAIILYENQGDAALAFQLAGMALPPYRQAYSLAKKKTPERYDELLQKGYTAGLSLQKEEQLNSSFPSIALDYLAMLDYKRQWEEANQAEKQLTVLLGSNWKERAKDPAAPYTLTAQKLIVPA